MQIMSAIQEIFNRPSIPFDANRQSLKAWTKYCLQDRGFKVLYAQNADFAIETSTGEKLYFKVSTTTENLDPSVSWIVVEQSGQTAKVIPLQRQGEEVDE